MKRTKRIWVLLGVLAVICGATLLLNQYEEKQERIQAANLVLLQIPEEDVTALSWEYSGGGSLSFTREEDGWVYDGDADFPVSEVKIRQILGHFREFSVTFRIEDVTDYSQYGLDDPECILHISGNETDHTLRLGAFSKMDQQRYMDIGDGCVYLVEEDPEDYLTSSLSAMIQHDDTPGFESVNSITFSGTQSYTITREENSTATYAPEDDIYFTTRDGKTVPLDTASIRKYLNTITALDLMNYVTYHATEEDLKTFGLDAPVLTIEVDYAVTDDDGNATFQICTVHISENPEERAAADEAEAAGEAPGSVTKYVRIGDSSIVYTLDNTDFAILKAASYDDLRHKTLFWGDFSLVNGIEVELEGSTHTLTLQPLEDEEDETGWFYEGREADLSEFRAALENLTADSFTVETPGERLELSLTLHLTDENFSEVSLSLYRYDGSFCLAQVDGKSVCLLPRSLVMALVEAVQSIVLS